jgi:hypothetical protein
MYLVKGKWLAPPRIDNAMRRGNYQIVGDKGACAPNGVPVAGSVDLTNRSPRGALLVNCPPIVIAYDARLLAPRGHAAEDETT